MASCLDVENKFSLKVIASFSASHLALPSIPLIVLHSLVRSVFSLLDSTKFLFFFQFVHADAIFDLYSILAVDVKQGIFFEGHLVCSSRALPLLEQVLHGICGVQ